MAAICSVIRLCVAQRHARARLGPVTSVVARGSEAGPRVSTDSDQLELAMARGFKLSAAQFISVMMSRWSRCSESPAGRACCHRDCSGPAQAGPLSPSQTVRNGCSGPDVRVGRRDSDDFRTLQTTFPMN